ncbi:hypothetical protein ACN47E_005139 [Coniothyrium glycines]
MWRSNVLRVRNWSSAARNPRDGLTTRWYSSAQSLPITQQEFTTALAGVLDWKWGGTQSKAMLGFAISGGVDSMALAALYCEAQASANHLPKAHGFIVDHKLRPESTEEAEWVAEQLRSKFDMDSTVLPLQWPKEFDASDPKGLETDARIRRYQALGRACRAQKITRLLVAHHADDQAETVLMRLANNRLRSGLQGMQSIEWIPECEGIYGVYHSGGFQRQDALPHIPFPVEKGGVQILRPLLRFEKSRLVATCENKGVEWAEDRTNHVQTYTSRNAIRHVYKHHRLPEALSISSLVDVSLTMQRRIQTHKAFAQRLFDQCLIKLDIQTGAALVQFPPFEALLNFPIDSASRLNEAKNNAYCLLERVAELVSPKPKAPLGQLAATIPNIYPEFREAEEGQQAEELASEKAKAFSRKDINWEKSLRKNYSVFSVWWRFSDGPSPFERNNKKKVNHGSAKPHEWLLTRQPPEEADRANETNKVVYPPAPLVNTAPVDPLFEEASSSYQLFDGRFWIHLRNLSSHTLILRLFSKDDYHQMAAPQQERASKTRGNHKRPYRYIFAAFSLLKPTDIRYTLPAVFQKDSETGEEKLIGFPTLNVCINGFGPPEHLCEWSVRYKKIDPCSRSTGDIISPGLSREDILAHEKRHRLKHVGIMRLMTRPGKVAEKVEPGAERKAKARSTWARSSDFKRIPGMLTGQEAERRALHKDSDPVKENTTHDGRQ